MTPPSSQSLDAKDHRAPVSAGKAPARFRSPAGIQCSHDRAGRKRTSGTPQAKTETAPSSIAAGQETILRKAEDKASARKTPAEPAIRKTADKYVTLDFDNVNIEVFVKFVSELTGKNFIIDEKVKGKVTILSPKKIPLRDVYKVFLSVLEINGFATVPVGDMIKIVPSIVATGKERGNED